MSMCVGMCVDMPACACMHLYVFISVCEFICICMKVSMTMCACSFMRAYMFEAKVCSVFETSGKLVESA